jgi:hypothetical protein
MHVQDGDHRLSRPEDLCVSLSLTLLTRSLLGSLQCCTAAKLGCSALRLAACMEVMLFTAVPWSGQG